MRRVIRLARRVVHDRRVGLVLDRRDIDRATGGDNAAALASRAHRHLGAGQAQVAACNHRQVATGTHLAQLMHHTAVALGVAADQRVVGAARLDRIKTDLVAGRDHGATRAELARKVRQVAPGVDAQGARGDNTGRVRQGRRAAAVLLRGPAVYDHQRLVPDVAPGLQCDVAAGNAAAAVDDVLPGHQHRAAIAAVDHAADVGDAVGDVDRHAVAVTSAPPGVSAALPSSLNILWSEGCAASPIV